MILAIVLVALVASSHASMVSYEGYKVFRITPHTIHNQQVLENLKKTNYVDVWTSGRNVSQSWDIMVEPKLLKSFESTLVLNKMDYKVLIQNVEASLSHNVSLDLPKSGRISFEQYHRYETIKSYLETIAELYPEVATLINIGQTFEGRDILGLKISSGGSNKPVILADGGLRSREWIGPPNALYIIQELVENPDNAHMFKNVDWYIIPLLNIDGYEYTFTNDRMWPKTRSVGKSCQGVDANRNFGFHWNETDTSGDECDEKYSGPKAFSEPETQALRDFVLQLENVKLYLSFQCCGTYLIYPWGYSHDYPDNNDELYTLGEAANAAFKDAGGTEFFVGTASNTDYNFPTAGGSTDWMMGVAGVPLAYIFKYYDFGYGYLIPEWAINELVTQTFASVRVFQKYVEDQYAKPNNMF